MATSEAAYTLDNTWEKAHRRLTLLERIYDDSTIGRLTAVGVGPGWRCLELGAGAGSITRWLCDRVGAGGRVIAVDLEPIFLERDPRPNLEIHRRDILADEIPGEGYDLIHARALFMHLPDKERLLADLAGRLRPGGTIVLEEGDLFSIMALTPTELYAEVWAACAAAAATIGADWNWARHLPSALAAAGLVDVTSTVEVDLVPGGEDWAELVALSWEQLAPRLEANGFPPERLAKAFDELNDTSLWFPTCSIVAGIARRLG